MKKKILFTYAEYGSGHKSAAKNIMNYFLNKNNDFEIKELNISDYRSFYGLLAEKSFEANFKHTNSFGFGTIYKIFNNKYSLSPMNIVTKKLYKYDTLKKIIQDYSPDLTISTHFFPSILISELNKENVINCKIITIITDYIEHECWLKNVKNEDALIVCNEFIKNKIISKHNIDKNKICPFGIPLSNNFKENTHSKDKTYEKYDLDKSKKTILFFAGGGYGSAYSFNYLKLIIQKKLNANIIYVCGKNNELKETASKYIKDKNVKNVKVLGFTDDVMNLMNISTLVITKPGGLTLTECLEMKKPILLIQGNNANEKYNAKFVCKKGYGFKPFTKFGFIKILNNSINNDKFLHYINKNLNKYKDNKSSENIYKLSIKLLKK